MPRRAAEGSGRATLGRRSTAHCSYTTAGVYAVRMYWVRAVRVCGLSVCVSWVKLRSYICVAVWVRSCVAELCVSRVSKYRKVQRGRSRSRLLRTRESRQSRHCLSRVGLLNFSPGPSSDQPLIGPLERPAALFNLRNTINYIQ